MQDDLAGLLGRIGQRIAIRREIEAESSGLAKSIAKARADEYEVVKVTLETLARENADLRDKDDGWERVGFLEEKLRQAEDRIEMLHGYLPKYQTALAERKAALKEVEKLRADPGVFLTEKNEILRSQLTATQARLDEAVGIIKHCLNGALSLPRFAEQEMRAFLAQQEANNGNS